MGYCISFPVGTEIMCMNPGVYRALNLNSCPWWQEEKQQKYSLALEPKLSRYVLYTCLDCSQDNDFMKQVALVYLKTVAI